MNNSALTKEDIKELINHRDTSLTFVKPETSSSRAWRSFSYVYVNDRKQDVVSCDKCKDVLQHKSTDGTSSMVKHQKSCEKEKSIYHNSSSIKEYFNPKTTSSIPRNLREKITNACVEFVALDNRAFEIVSGDGFMNLARTIFNAGQDLKKSRDINVSDLLPHPTTVSENTWNLESNQ